MHKDTIVMVVYPDKDKDGLADYGSKTVIIKMLYYDRQFCDCNISKKS